MMLLTVPFLQQLLIRLPEAGEGGSWKHSSHDVTQASMTGMRVLEGEGPAQTSNGAC